MRKNFFIKSFGCSANKSDAEVMAGLLGEAGYSLTSLEEAEYVLVNTCGVKQPTEDRVISTLKQLSSLNKKLIISGCLPRINFERIVKNVPSFSAMLDPRSVHLIVDIVRKIDEGQNNLVVFSDEPPIKPSLPKHLLNPVIGIIQIAEGCTMACTYCCTRFARGSIYCYPNYEIVKEAHGLIEKGCKEIWITSQDNGIYDFEGMKLPDILEGICKIEGEFFIRVGMMNPLHVKGILKGLIESFLDEKVYKFLHLPLQSASVRILELMRRGYPPKTVMDIIYEFLEYFPSLTLSTDIIVGFPTEDDTDLEDTIKFVQKIKPDIMNISKFGARPGTEASKFEQLPHSVVNRRCKELVQIAREVSYEKNLNWLGWSGRCLIDEKGKKDGTWIGRNFAYKPIVVKSEQNILGRFLNVEVVEAKSTYLLGKPI
ncbi:MAG: tRNA (N(6)-L-threonylcarbamoyladenosine(37)-C(2))-methylthiotransferase [archaeon]|nr:tRNA (N(6)-L-threonylcarbamoyladenosine(37)-C(2))-methylthiotransferase [archaeon]MCP8306097.1 tRNA (N(6)-L-threonylcarbamoyladenosine(37)-C(2))-methylthiotransferase [archaeon]